MISYIIWGIIWIILSTAFFFVKENMKLKSGISKSDDLIKKAEHKRDSILEKANKESSEILAEAKKESYEINKKAEKIEEKILEKEGKMLEKESKILEKEEKILDREAKIEKKLELVEEKQTSLLKKEEEIKNKHTILDEKEKELEWKIAEISKLTEIEAREIFLKQVEEKYSSDWLWIISKFKKKIEEEKKEISRDIIIKSIQQYAWDVTWEVTTTVITIPSDDIKWKLIWKEWRNITTFEKTAWVSLIIDDTPNTVFISAFDLYRRYIAKKSLEKLIEDGRIQPTRIEEVILATEKDTEILLKVLWKKVLDELWITNLPEEIIPVIWKLRFRTSYWQNILKHSKEVAIIAESIANEFWLDWNLVKIWWLLHDIWKALDQEIEWTHPELWARLARKYKLDPKLIDMIENHHDDQMSISLEAAIVQVADAISSVRPWARREAIEQYIKRVQEMEALVQSFSWVSKAFAISAWREIRVFVDAETVSDLHAQNMAKEIADSIQEKLSYPWEVKINLIRELRVIEYAK